MIAARCPDCEAAIEIADDVLAGEIVTCPDCGLEFEVEKGDGGQVALQKLCIEKEDWGE